jgi:hypothetical protein
VGQRHELGILGMNNFAESIFAVDKVPVVPELSTDLLFDKYWI